MAGCGRLDNNNRVVTGTPLVCGTKLTFGVNKEPRRTVIHLCADCEAKENSNGSGKQDDGIPSAR
jgi:hypothetical protein